MIISRAFSQPRTIEFYSQFFKPRYDAFRREVDQSPLVIMIWGPRQRTRLWSQERQQIRDNLKRLGHSVFLSEQLGVPLASLTQKGVEFLQSETTDLLVCLQSTYDPIGSVRHFVEHRVAACKMLLFVDAAAPDERLYRTSLDDLKVSYNNVGTFHFPDDVLQDNLTIQILEKIRLFQMVKFCAAEYANSWNLRYDLMLEQGASTELQPFHFNLLELYRAHRDEVDVLLDSAALFLLAYANYCGTITTKALAYQVGLGEAELAAALVPLVRSQLIVQHDLVLSVSAAGRQTLGKAGLVGIVPMTRLPQMPFRMAGIKAVLRPAGLVFAAILLALSLVFYWSNTVRNQLPLQFSPARTTEIRGATPSTTPPPIATPLSTDRR
jgi:hypothetical protein